MLHHSARLFSLVPVLCASALAAPLEAQVILFHAGSLSRPLLEIARAFELSHPGTKVIREAGGSRICARKISELGRPCDVLAVADYSVIDTLLVPNFATWTIKFAGNEMCLAYRKSRRHSDSVNTATWPSVLDGGPATLGLCDPDSAPCGYRGVHVLKLAEDYYGIPGFASRVLERNRRYVRPKEPEVLALLEAGAVDYALVYRSGAEQRGLPYVSLPAEINLSDPGHREDYASVSAEVSGNRPGTLIEEKGRPIVYGLTIPTDAPHPRAAVAFVSFLLDSARGMAVVERHGQKSLVPSPTASYAHIPDALKIFAAPEKDRARPAGANNG